MKKRTLGIIIPLLTCFTLFAQEYIMFEGIYLELKEGGEITKLESGVKKHNAKYHDGKNGPKAYLFNVLTGPYSGQYSWIMGPITLSHMDASLSSDHTKDWEVNVEKYARSHNYQYSTRDEELTYNPDNEVVGTNILQRVFDVKNKSKDMEAVVGAIKSIKETLVKMDADIARRVYRNQFRSPERKDISLVYPFKSWTRFEDSNGLPPNFSASYDKINGKGSWQKNVINVLDNHTDGWYDEIRVMIK